MYYNMLYISYSIYCYIINLSTDLPGHRLENPSPRLRFEEILKRIEPIAALSQSPRCPCVAQVLRPAAGDLLLLARASDRRRGRLLGSRAAHVTAMATLEQLAALEARVKALEAPEEAPRKAGSDAQVMKMPGGKAAGDPAERAWKPSKRGINPPEASRNWLETAVNHVKSAAEAVSGC